MHPARPKISSAPSAFLLLGVPQAPGNKPPPKGGKGLGRRLPEAGGHFQCQGTPGQIRAVVNRAGQMQPNNWRGEDSNITPSGAFRQDLSNHATMPHPGQSHNVVIYMRDYIKHDSWSGGCEFDLPNCLFLSPWSHFTRPTYSCTLWAATCMISLATFLLSHLCIISLSCSLL